MTYILLNWPASVFNGWGLSGLHTFFRWAISEDVQPIMGAPITGRDVALIDPMRLHRVKRSIEESNRISGQLRTPGGDATKVNCTVVQALGNKFAGIDTPRGPKNIGRIVFEDTAIAPFARQQAPKYDLLVCCSEWNANLLRQSCLTEVVVTPEGIDPSVFFPGPRSGLMNQGMFHIFSGGKIEHRKAQDLVLLAFREFSRRHDDAVLVSNWHSPWPQHAVGFRGRLEHPIELDPAGRLNVKKWASDNGVDPGRIIDIGPIPNQITPWVLREMDCAVFPSRCEGGTNLVAMEAMACGVPVVLGRNTGVVDIITEQNCLTLDKQGAFTSPQELGTEGWGEADVDEIIEALERLYSSQTLRRELGLQGAAHMSKRTWVEHGDILKHAIVSRL
jgi:glycosyltransferase involved in cell wall biosynthesis